MIDQASLKQSVLYTELVSYTCNRLEVAVVVGSPLSLECDLALVPHIGHVGLQLIVNHVHLLRIESHYGLILRLRQTCVVHCCITLCEALCV